MPIIVKGRKRNSMGRPVVDLTGQRFGMLTVEYLYPEDKVDKSGRKHKQWFCSCDCGGHKIITGDYLKQGHAKSCGCTNAQENFVGKRFGKLLVLERIERKGKHTHYICLCDCGNEVEVDHYDLRDGKRLDCGKCEKKKRPFRLVDLRGQRFGKLTVLDEDPVRHITPAGAVVIKWHCLCDCGRDTYVTSAALRNGTIKSCGCLLAEKFGMTMDEFEQSYANRTKQTGRKLDLTGQRFGRLIAIEPAEKSKSGRTRWLCRCDCGCETIVQTTNLTNGHTQSCGCINSVGEIVVERYLKENNIQYKRFYRDQRCVDERMLPFDFAIFNNGKLVGLIEYDGEQHFYAVRFNGMTQERAEEAFIEGQIHDRMKNEFCEKYNIPLLRIRYDQRDDVDTLIHEFISVIDNARIA